MHDYLQFGNTLYKYTNQPRETRRQKGITWVIVWYSGCSRKEWQLQCLFGLKFWGEHAEKGGTLEKTTEECVAYRVPKEGSIDSPPLVVLLTVLRLSSFDLSHVGAPSAVHFWFRLYQKGRGEKPIHLFTPVSEAFLGIITILFPTDVLSSSKI